MKALLPHREIKMFEAGHVWFAQCPDCGVYVSSGIFYHVEHAKKYHNLGAFTSAICLQMEQKQKKVADMSEFECETLILNAFYDVPIIKENPELEGKSLKEIFAYLKKKLEK